jgi:hypothetical protein
MGCSGETSMKKDKAWKVLSSPAKWCKKYYSKDKLGNGSTCIVYENAVKFCVVGAYCEAYGVDVFRAELILNPLGITAKWNDSCTYKQMIAKLKELDL